jgi:hypothetical protein
LILGLGTPEEQEVQKSEFFKKSKEYFNKN